MKKLSQRLSSLTLALLLLFSVSVYAEESSIVDIAVGNSDFSILVQALQTANLVGALQGEGPFTVFAPTNDAFVKLLEGLNISAADLLAHPQLSEVLLYHVVAGQVLSTDLSDGLSAPTLNGESITVDLSDGVKINSSNVTTADVLASNGVIHIIDSVLVQQGFVLSAEESETEVEPISAPVPGTVVDIALSSPDFSMLVSLLQKADLVGALQGEGPFTVFAPTNAAFEKLLGALGITASDLMNQPDLAKVLLYHVVSGSTLSTDLSNGLSVNSLNGEALTFDLSDGAKVNTSMISAVDLVAGNGVVHVIDTVLVPSNFTYQAVAEDVAIPQTGTSSILPILALLVGLLGISVLGLKKYAPSKQ